MSTRITRSAISAPQDFEHVAHASHEDVAGFLKTLKATDSGVGPSASGSLAAAAPTCPAATEPTPDATIIVRQDLPDTGPFDVPSQKSKSWLPFGGASSSPPSRTSSIESTNGTSGSDAEDEEPAISSVTAERATAAKVWLENYFEGIMRATNDRAARRQRLEAEMEADGLPEEQRQAMRQRLFRKESDYIRLRRMRISTANFEDIKVIGRGAFGVVKLVRERDSGQIYAMKCLSKLEMIRKRQEGHVRSERDILASAADATSIVRMYYSFQDKENLYLVMDYMAGGDLLNLLIKLDIFPEPMAKFYMAEMVLAVEEVHNLGFIHRDIKPDNFLFTADGHLKVSDFGLSTGFHWSHDVKYYEGRRKAAMQLMAKKIDELKAKDPTKMKEILEKDSAERALQRYRQNRKKKAYSVVGTNNYIAPEVLLQVGYGQECDWWSVGVILFEMLFGYPPFSSDSRQTTKLKIVNWRETLRFPSKPKVSAEARDLIERLICDHQNRLGANGADEVKAHPFFRGIDWATLRSSTPPYRPELKSPTDTSCFDEVPPEKAVPLGRPANGPSPPVQVDEESWSETAFYGFTHRGFYNLTRKDNADGQGGMDPLQAAVLKQLQLDKERERAEAASVRAK